MEPIDRSPTLAALRKGWALLWTPQRVGVDGVIEAVVPRVLALATRDLAGREVLPGRVRVEVRCPGAEAVGSLVGSVPFRQELEARLLARLAEPDAARLPRLTFQVAEGGWDVRCTAEMGARRWEVRVEPPPAECPLWWDEARFVLPASGVVRGGRGPWHGAEGGWPNLVVLPEAARFVSRAAFELEPWADRLLVRPGPNQAEYLRVVGPDGLWRPVDPWTGELTAWPGDALVLPGESPLETITLTVHDTGGRHG